MDKRDYVVVIGGGAIDEYYGANRWIDLGDKVQVEEMGTTFGGTMFNAASVVAGLGNKTYIIDVLSSNDHNTAPFLEKYTEMGIDNGFMMTHPEAKNCKCLIVLVNGEKSIFVIPPKRPPMDFPKEWMDLLCGAKYIYSIAGDVHNIIKDVDILRKAKKSGAKFVMDGDTSYQNDWEVEIAKTADILILNEFCHERLEKRMGGDCINKLLADSAEMVVVTLGKDGCEIYTRDEKATVGEVYMEKVDTTGAGDTFSGALIHCQMKGMSVKNTALFANSMASRSIGYFGPIGGRATETEILDFMKERNITLES